MAALCSNTAGKGISMLCWPSDPSIARLWTQFVKQKRQWEGPTQHSALCSNHFTAESFDPHYDHLISMGFGRVRKLLPTAVPTIWQDPSMDIPTKKPRKGAQKREHARVSRLRIYVMITLVTYYCTVSYPSLLRQSKFFLLTSKVI